MIRRPPAMILLDFLYAFLGFSSRVSAKAKVWIEWKRMRQEFGSIPELERLYAKFRSSPEAGWTIAEDDVLRLYHMVLQYRPKHILELGTGIGLSTAVMALALKKLGSGEITSLEQLKKCIEIANVLIDPELKRFVRIVHAAPAIFRIDQLSRWIYFCGYDWQPSEGARFDFVLVDGPSGWVADGELVSLDSGDIFRLVPFLVPGCKVYIDGRRTTVKKIKRYLSPYLTLLERDSKFALFERTDHPVSSMQDLVVTDVKLASRAGLRAP